MNVVLYCIGANPFLNGSMIVIVSTSRGVGRNLSGGGGGVVLNAIFQKVIFALISSLTLYIGNV